MYYVAAVLLACVLYVARVFQMVIIPMHVWEHVNGASQLTNGSSEYD